MNFFDRISYEFNKGNSAIRQIILINISIFIVTLFARIIARLMEVDSNGLFSYFYLPSNLSVLMMRPWTIVTNIFFHASGIWHILFNMLILYFIGRILQDFMSKGKIWTIFLGGGILGGLFFVIASNVFPTFSDVVDRSVLLGASGGVTAIIVATGLHLPHYVVRPYNLFNIEMRWLALILVGLDLLNMPDSNNLGGLFAHLGGAVFGLLYILNLQGKIELPSFDLFKPKKMKTVHYDEAKRKTKITRKADPDQEQIDAILDKISVSGYDSLTAEEKEILFKASE